MNILSKYLIIGLSSVVALGAFSCSDDDEVAKTPLKATQPSFTASQHKLTFSWEPVEGCTQYGYQFSKEGAITAPKGGVTPSTSITFSDLLPSTTYELKVWAFADLESDFTTSPVATITATTADLIPLEAPQIEVEVKSSVATISWAPVESAASYDYTYVLNGAETSGNTTDTSLRINDVPLGTHSVSVTAIPGDDIHAASSTSSASFTRQTQVVMSVEGTYTSSQTGTAWTCKLEKTDDGGYTLYSWYGVEGYDLVFSVDPETSELIILNASDTDSYGYYYVPTGTSIGDLPCYPSDGFSSFTSSSTGGTITLYVWGADGGTDTFVWGDGGSGLPPFTIDSIIGSYTVEATGYSYDYDANDYIEASFTSEVTINKVSDTQIEMTNFFIEGSVLTATVDIDALTITFQPQMIDQYYQFACPTYDSDWNLTPTEVIADINDSTGEITIRSWATVYSGYTYDEYENSVLKKK